jgi:PKD repeat protein
MYNGYKGKRYWDGGDITTAGTFDLRGGLVHSFGDSAYRSGSFGGSGWTGYTVAWDETSLAIPENATVRAATLFVPYTWDNSNEADTISISFNGATATRGSVYTDRSNFGAYDDYDYGLQVYDVTSSFKKNARNTARFSRGSSGAKLSPYGLTLAVVYEDSGSSRKQIFINEGFDLLGADESNYGTTPEEATAYVPFTGLTVDPSSASRAELVTFVASGDGEGNLLFNGVSVGGGWDFGSVSGPQVAVLTRDVKGSLKKTGNIAAIRSTPGETPCMAPIQQFLIIDYGQGVTANATAAGALAANFSATPRSGPAPLRVNFTDTSTGSPEGWAWDFGNDGVVDSTEQNPEYIFEKPGNFTVGLTVRNATASSSARKSGYIIVLNPAATTVKEATLPAGNPTVSGQEMRAPPAAVATGTAAVSPVQTADADPRHSRDLVVHLSGFFRYVAEQVSGAVTTFIQNIPFVGNRGRTS